MHLPQLLMRLGCIKPIPLTSLKDAVNNLRYLNLKWPDWNKNTSVFWLYFCKANKNISAKVDRFPCEISVLTEFSFFTVDTLTEDSQQNINSTMTGSKLALWIIHFANLNLKDNTRNWISSLKINNACKKTIKILLFSLMQTYCKMTNTHD